MKRSYLPAAAALLSIVLFASCRDVFTTSLGSALDRGKPDYSSMKLSDLVDLANEPLAATDVDTAYAIVDALGDDDPAAIQALDVDDQAAILTLAATAAFDMAEITSKINSAIQVGADTDLLIQEALAAIDTSMDLGAVDAILQDADALDGIPVDVLAFAAAVFLADIASDIGATGPENVMETMALTDPADYGSIVDPDLQTRIDVVRGVVDALNARPQEELDAARIGDFDITDFIRGNQP